MPIRIEHHEGDVTTMDVATWTDRTASGKPVVRCCACGGIFEILTPIEPDGTATVACPWSCSFFDEVFLSGFSSKNEHDLPTVITE